METANTAGEKATRDKGYILQNERVTWTIANMAPACRRTLMEIDGEKWGRTGPRGHKRRLMDGKDHLNATRDSG